MPEPVTDEDTLTLTITGRTGSWLVSGVLGEEDLPLRGMSDEALAEMLRALLPSSAVSPGPDVLLPAPPAPRGGRHRRSG